GVMEEAVATPKGSSWKKKKVVKAAAEGVDDVKVKAVNEMMERIKHGVVLRPVKSQDTKVRRSTEKQQESAMEELKGILVKRAYVGFTAAC
uniref:Uncharacterized protein n=2 Tax=Haplochromini TaxID=319058 RepID=A0A3Q2UT18_HAPBU